MQAEVMCAKGDFNPAIGLHGEAVKNLRSRGETGQDYLTQWANVCHVVFQDNGTVPPPGTSSRVWSAKLRLNPQANERDFC